jgi:integration host factor subunit beta
MNRTQLIEALTRRIPTSSKNFKTLRANQKVVDRFFEIITQAILAEQRIEIRGFGSFIVKSYKSYVGRDPRTGEQVVVNPKKMPFFKPGKNLREIVNTKIIVN